MLEVCFLGTGNAFNSSGKGNQCLLLRSHESCWMLDCGPTSALQAVRFGVDLGALDGIFLTHLHGDHALGLAALLLHFRYIHKRERPLTLVGPPGSRDYLDAVWKLAYPDVSQRPLGFELEVHELDGSQRASLELGDTALQTLPMRHSIPVNAYRVALQDRVVALSGDTGPTPVLAELGADADLVVIECSFLKPFSPSLHMSVEEHRPGLPYGAQRVALIHTGPEVWQQRELLAAELDVVFPDDGDRITLAE